MSIIHAENVSVCYIMGDLKNIGLKEYIVQKIRGQYNIKEFWANKNISFRLERGDMMAIIGTNGAGKSTLLKAISGVMKPSSGKIIVRGKIAALLELASGFDGELTVRENTYLRGAMLGYTRSFLDEQYEKIINFAELEAFQDRPFKRLSSGMKSRLAFSIASLVSPDIIILDEVLSVGDGSFKEKSAAKMKEILDSGVTGILVSHSIAQIRQMCNKVLWLDHGNQIGFSDQVEVYCNAYEEFLKTGELPANELEIQEMGNRKLSRIAEEEKRRKEVDVKKQQDFARKKEEEARKRAEALEKKKREEERAKKDKERLIMENKRLTEVNQQLIISKEGVVQNNHRLAEESDRLSKANEQLTEANKSLAKENKELSDSSARLSKNNEQLKQNSQKLEKANLALVKANEDLTRANTRLQNILEKEKPVQVKFSSSFFALEVVTGYMKNINCARIDIKNWGTAQNDLDFLWISDANVKKTSPQWFCKDGKGYVLESNKGKIKFSVCCHGDGELRIVLRGKDVRKKDGGRLPIWIDYSCLKINEDIIFDSTISAWHDRPYIYKRIVQDGEHLDIEISQELHSIQ